MVVEHEVCDNDDPLQSALEGDFLLSHIMEHFITLLKVLYKYTFFLLPQLVMQDKTIRLSFKVNVATYFKSL